MKIIFVLCFFITHLTAFAQGYLPEKILNPNNPEYFAERIDKVYTGEPIVKIGGGKVKNTGPRLNLSTKEELAEKDPPLNLIYNIKTPFGIPKTAINTDHTTDFYTKIQVIDNKNLLIHENIQFVTTKPTKIERVLPLILTKTNMKPFEINVLSFEKNGKNINYTINQTKKHFHIQSVKEYPAGVHSINFKYILKNGIQNINSLSHLFVSITGPKWKFPINRFRVIVLYPHSPINYQKDLLFGNNNVSINESFLSSTDIKGNTLYTNTRPIPAFADVRILETFNGKNLPLSFDENFLEKYFNYLLTGFAFICLSFYLTISNIYLKKQTKKGENILKKINDLPTCVLMMLCNRNFSSNNLSDFKRIEKTCKKSSLKTKVLRTCFKIKGMGGLVNFLLKSTAIFYLTYKYILTGGILFFIIMHTIILDNYSKNKYLIIATILIYLIELIYLYKKTIKPSYLNAINDFKKKILNPYLCYGLNDKTIISFYKRYYKTVYILGIHDDLKQVITEHSKNISLPSLKSKGK